MAGSSANPDSSGSWRYAILLARFTSTGLQQGTVKSFGILIPALVHRLDSNYKTVGFMLSMEYAVFFMTCPFVHLLSRRFDPRPTAILGALLASVCLMSASRVQSVWAMGAILIATGALTSPVYQTTQVLLHDHFKHRYAAANAIGSTGSQAGGVILPLVTSLILSAYGVDGALLCLGAIFLNFVVIATTLRSCENRVALDNVKVAYQRLSVTSSDKDDAELTDRDEHSRKVDESDSRSKKPQGFLSQIVGWLAVVTDIQTMRAEKLYCGLVLPCIFLHQMAYIGWALFMYPFAISIGITPSNAAYLPMTGAIGGLIGRVVFGIILYARPGWGKHTLVSAASISSLALLIYPFIATLWFQLLCTFFTGFGLSATFSSFYAVLDNSVERKNFPGIIAVTSFTRGLGVAMTGYMTGLLSELTGTFAVSIRFLGCMDAVVIVLIIVFATTKRRS